MFFNKNKSSELLKLELSIYSDNPALGVNLRGSARVFFNQVDLEREPVTVSR